MKNNKVTVYVSGRRFVLVSPEKEEYVKGVAERVNDRLNDITKNYTQLDAWGCAVMAALDFADDEQKALGKKAELIFQADKVLKQADKLSKQIVEIKKKDAEMQAQYDKLFEQYEDLKKKNSNLTSQYNELKKFLEKQVGLNKTTGNIPAQKTADTADKTQNNTTNDNSKNSQTTNSGEAKKESSPESSKKESTANGKTEITHGTKPVVSSTLPQPKENQSTMPKKATEPANKGFNEVKKNSKAQENLLVKNTEADEKQKEKDDILKPQSAADVMRKGYVPLRQYSLFDDENK